MIKYIQCLSFLTFVLLGISCNSNKNLAKNEKTTIKTIKTFGYSSELKEKMAQRGKAFSFYEYDKNGNIIMQEQFDQNGKLKNRNIYEYDDFGNQIKSSFYSNSTRINSYSKSEYIYDNARKFKIKRHESGNQYKQKSKSKTEYFYNNDNLIEEVKNEIWLGEKETITKRYKYNKLNSIDSTHVYKDEHLYKTTAFKYNDNGLLLESFETTYPKGGNPEYMTVLKKYDNKGNIILEIAEDPNGYYYKKTTEFNSFGLKTKFKEYKKNGDIITNDSYKYLLDENQNWITSETFSFGKSDWITEREIEYY